MSPLGFATRMPLVRSAPLAEVPNGVVFLGAGEVDLKVSLKVDEFVAASRAHLGVSCEFADVVG